MSLSQDHINNLVALFARHDMLGKLDFLLLHKHDSILDGQVKLETKLETVPDGKWIKPTSINSLDLNDIHGTVFNFVPGENCLVPYEFGKGPSPRSNIDNNAVKGFIDYITKHDLVGKIALQVSEAVKDGGPKERTAEVELGEKNGTVVLPVSMFKAPDFIPTGWPDPEGPGPNEYWQKQVVKDKETHRVFVDQIENETGLLDELVRQGIIRV